MNNSNSHNVSSVAFDASRWYAEQAIAYLTSPAARVILREHAAETERIVAKMREAHNIPQELLHAPFNV